VSIADNYILVFGHAFLRALQKPTKDFGKMWGFSEARF
jgi:hypothetical protein